MDLPATTALPTPGSAPAGETSDTLGDAAADLPQALPGGSLLALPLAIAAHLIDNLHHSLLDTVGFARIRLAEVLVGRSLSHLPGLPATDQLQQATQSLSGPATDHLTGTPSTTEPGTSPSAAAAPARAAGEATNSITDITGP
ncbi:hypothetical protein E1287_37060 [Actinomadura sp. KC06]|uniref:hypothetical protein n=1 Tax=Actinomadura sp. KC06 TaxID=2530369 RepID=UPI00104D904E|nr:hypothetical protein [Actinomadura sp. KC06]TDD25631.1 hypothetical protein E1287_37060 [Actinomadura sp. KC06]